MDHVAVTSALHLAVANFDSSNPSLRPPTFAHLVAVLAAQPDLAFLENCTIAFDDLTGAIVVHETLAEWLLGRAHTAGTDTAVRDLATYLADPMLPVTTTTILGDIHVPYAVNLGHDVQLLPFKELPRSAMKGGIEQAWHIRPRPTAALTVSDLYVKPHGEEWLRVRTRRLDLEDARLVLTLVSPFAPIAITSWASTPPGVPLWNVLVFSTFPHPEEYSIRAEEVPMTSHQLQRAKLLYTAFYDLPVPLKEHLRIPLDRLNRAMRRRRVADSAIDLGIALESLFLTDVDSTELTFRLRTRAARFLEATLDSRRSIDTLVGRLYTLRSKAVHSGTVPQELSGIATSALLGEGYTVTARAIEKIVEQGRVPDWSTIVLG